MNIVLDLDETLVSVTSKPLQKYDFEFMIGNIKYYAKKRPNLGLFLRYIFKNFATVSVWTAATRPYAMHVINNIMTKGQRSQLTHVLARENLAMKRDGTLTKPLAKIFKSRSNRKGLEPNNTIMIDDKKSATGDNLGNAIIVPAWKGSANDKCLPKLVVILDGILKLGHELAFGSYKKEFTLKELTN